MDTNIKFPEPGDRKVVLSLLWIFVTLNYIYCDVMSLMDSNLLNQYLSGNIEGFKITDSFLFGAALLMEIPIIMIFLSRTLRYRVNRWANIIAGSIKTIVMILSMFVGTPTLYYLFFGTIEIVCTTYIIWYAWTWINPAIAPTQIEINKQL